MVLWVSRHLFFFTFHLCLAACVIRQHGDCCLLVVLMGFKAVNSVFLLNGNQFSFQPFCLPAVFSSFPIRFIPLSSDLCHPVSPTYITLQTCSGAVVTLVTLTRSSPRCQWTWLRPTSWSSWTWTRTTSSASPTPTPNTLLLQINVRPTQTGGLLEDSSCRADRKELRAKLLLHLFSKYPPLFDTICPIFHEKKRVISKCAQQTGDQRTQATKSVFLRSDNVHVMMDLFRNLSKRRFGDARAPVSPASHSRFWKREFRTCSRWFRVCIHAIRTLFQLTFHEKHKIALQLKPAYTWRPDLT